MLLGERIKELRLGCNLTQEELADRAELTKGYISQLENDLTSPSIATLIDILAALGTDLKEFFSSDDSTEKIVFSEQEFIEKVGEGYTQNWLVPNSQKNLMEPLLMVLQPHSQTEKDIPHDGEEFGYVLKGTVTIVIGKKKYVAKKGESFYFECDKPHYIINDKDKPAEFVWVSTPPNF